MKHMASLMLSLLCALTTNHSKRESLPMALSLFGLGRRASILPSLKLESFSLILASLPSTSPRHYSNTPGVLVPPEVYFLPQKPLSFPTDIWTLACTLWSIIGQQPLFEGFNPGPDWMIKEHVDTIGKLPSEWWHKWDARLRWFNEEGRRDHGGVNRSLVESFNSSVHHSRQEFQ